MKNSNRILLGAALAFMAAMFFYSRALKAEYLKADYKDPYFSFTSLGLSGFNAVDNRVGNLINVVIKKGSKFDVKVLNNYKDNLNIYKSGNRLIIDVEDSLRTYYNQGKAVVILCPEINELTVEAQKITDYNREKKLVTDYPGKDDYETMIEGFQLSNLTIKQGRENRVKLKNNTIGSLRSSLGGTEIKNADLEISSDNKIEEAYFTTYSHNHLSLFNPTIKKVKFNVEENAGITLTGAALNWLKK